MPRSSKWTVKYGYCELEILWTHKRVMLKRYPGGKMSTMPWGRAGTPEIVIMSTKGFSVLAKGFLKRWGEFQKSKNYRRYQS